MPIVRPYASTAGRLLIAADYQERNYNAAVRDRFLSECASRGYDTRLSIREGNTKGLQAWQGECLAGEYWPKRSEAWVASLPPSSPCHVLLPK